MLSGDFNTLLCQWIERPHKVNKETLAFITLDKMEYIHIYSIYIYIHVCIYIYIYVMYVYI